MTRPKKTAIVLSSVAAGLALLILLGLILTGIFVCWGPFADMANLRFKSLAGNADRYSVETVETLEDSPLSGTNLCFLGSSVTYGASSLQTSFVEYIAKRNNATYVKEAMSGTTLVEEGIGSYISRLKKLDKSAHFDLFVCQLSTNDATQNKALGSVSAEGTESFDTTTICGAIEYIITYVRQTWGCPVAFYTNAYYENKAYAAMVDALYAIAQKYDIGVIDLYTDRQFNDITEEQYKLYMADKIHPTKAGYLEWWTPKMESAMYDLITERPAAAD